MMMNKFIPVYNATFGDWTFSNDKTKIILLDIQIPRIDGMEVLEKLKENLKTKLIPVVILVCSDDDPNIQKCKSLRAADYIIKPVTMKSL
jgi:response regulator RpfG family c-di-GMP phosphodiesterase